MTTVPINNPDELPEGWAWASLEAVCSRIQDGTHHSPNDQSDSGDYKYITAKNIKTWGIDLRNVTYVSEATHRPIYQRCNPELGDVLLIKDGATTGIATVNPLDEEFSLLSSVALLKPISSLVDPHFLKWYLNSPPGYSSITGQMTGSAITRIVLRAIRDSRFPLAPLAEQQRIVAAIEAQLPRVDQARSRLDRVPQILKCFRQQVLAAACSGALTSDWRVSQPMQGSGVELVKRLQEAHFAHGPRKSGRAVDPRRNGNEVPSSNVPPTWGLTELQWLCTPGRPVIYGIIKPGPHVPNGVPYVRVCEMKNGTIDVANLRRTSTERAKRFERATLRGGDILISKDGTIGRVALVPAELEGGNITQHVVRASIHGMIDTKYVAFAIQSPICQAWLTDETRGVALQGVNVEDFRRLPIPVPPVDEQQEIVRRVEALFALVGRVEQRVAAAQARADRLTQAILSRAFRGELVPTEAELARREGREYEPASVLLERIRQERAAEGAGAGRNGRRRG